ncbi:MAG: hypothetical protein V1747_09645 [Candidatus Omnitrophota bacterium]
MKQHIFLWLIIGALLANGCSKQAENAQAKGKAKAPAFEWFK